MTRVMINHMESGARMLNLLYCYHVFASLVQRPVQTDACSQRAGSLAWPAVLAPAGFSGKTLIQNNLDTPLPRVASSRSGSREKKPNDTT